MSEGCNEAPLATPSAHMTAAMGPCSGFGPYSSQMGSFGKDQFNWTTLNQLSGFYGGTW